MESFLIPYLTKDDTCTHLFLNGGKANIPPEKEKEFIRLYSRELDLGNKVYIVEKRPDIFRYMIDVDIIDVEYWNLSKIKKLVKLIQTVVFEFYEIDLNVICCLAPEKKCKSGIKTGVHLIWPRHFINCEDALTIREAILIKLKDWEPILNSWEDTLDELIYIRNGYRMVGSDKLVPKTNTPENRPYTLLCILDSKGEERTTYFDRLNNDNYSLILDTSIRFVSLENSKITIPFKKIPEWLPITNIKKSKKQKDGKTRLLGTVEYEIIQNFMESELPSCYKHQSIKDIRQYPDGNFLIITDSSYCMNIQRDHNSCGIYFFGTRKGIYQKCLCPCDNLKNRINGYCKNYTSECYPFSKDISNLLFPNPEIPKPKAKVKKTMNLCINSQTKSKYLKNHSSFCDDLFNSLQ